MKTVTMRTTMGTLVIWARAADEEELNRRLATELLELLPDEMPVSFTPVMIHTWRALKPYNPHVRMVVSFENSGDLMLDVPFPVLGEAQGPIVAAADQCEAAMRAIAVGMSSH